MARKSTAQLEMEAQAAQAAAAESVANAAALAQEAQDQADQIAAGTLPAEDGCVWMSKDGDTAEINENSVEIMQGLGWTLK